MSWKELIEKALKGKSVTATAKSWGIPQKTLDRYSKGERLPSFKVAVRIADEAGISHGDMLDILAAAENNEIAPALRKKQGGFVQTPLLTLMIGGVAVLLVYIM